MGGRDSQLVERLENSFDVWMMARDVSNDALKIRDEMIKEQLEKILTVPLRIWVADRDPENVRKLAELADKYVETRQGGTGRREEKNIANRKDRGRESGHMYEERGAYGGEAWKCGRETNGRSGVRRKRPKGNGKIRKGYRDTGAFISIIRKDIVERGQITGRKIWLVAMTGEEKAVVTAMVTWQINGVNKRLEVAVLENLPMEVLIGNDCGELLRTELTRAEVEQSQEMGEWIHVTGESAYEINCVIN